MLDTSSTLSSCTVPPFCPALLDGLTVGEKIWRNVQVLGCESGAPGTLSSVVSVVSTDNILSAPLLCGAGHSRAAYDTVIQLYHHPQSLLLLLLPPHPRHLHTPSPPTSDTGVVEYEGTPETAGKMIQRWLKMTLLLLKNGGISLSSKTTSV